MVKFCIFIMLSSFSGHLYQLVSGKQKNLDNNRVIYDGRLYKLSETEYMDRPWEVEAYQESPKITREIINNYAKTILHTSPNRLEK